MYGKKRTLQRPARITSVHTGIMGRSGLPSIAWHCQWRRHASSQLLGAKSKAFSIEERKRTKSMVTVYRV